MVNLIKSCAVAYMHRSKVAVLISYRHRNIAAVGYFLLYTAA